MAALVALGACSGGSDGSADGSVPAPDATPDAAPTDTAFDGRDGTPGDTMPAGDFATEIDDDTIIATEDGLVPTSTVEAAGAEDARPDADRPDTTVPRVSLPPAESVERIVSLSPTHTEILFALGLGDFVVAVDPTSDFPAEAVALQRADLDADLAQVEPVLALDPDVVVLGDDPTDLASRLSAAGVAAYVGPEPADLDGAFAQFADVAAIVGRPDLAEDLVARLRAEIDGIVEALPAAGPDGSRGTVFHELDPSLLALSDDTFLSNVYEELGLVNIVVDDEPVVRVPAGDVLEADPDVIVLGDAECCAVSIDVVGARPGWADMSAVRSGAVVEVDDDLLDRWGPRLVDLVRAVAGGVAAAG